MTTLLPFGSDSVFMDVAAIEPGRDFRKSIDQSLSSCGVFLSLIGKSWLTAKNASGQRRLDDPADFVRIETVAALSAISRSFPFWCKARYPPSQINCQMI